jgi:hypothetical protein
MRAIPWDLAEFHIQNYQSRSMDNKDFDMDSAYPECHFIAHVGQFPIRTDVGHAHFIDRVLHGRSDPFDNSSSSFEDEEVST